MNKRPFIILSAFLLLFSLIEKGQATETYRPETSVAGFIQLPGSGRQVYNFNPGWRFFRGDVRGAEAVNFDDRSWNVVSTPHTVELMPAEGSGCRNYQGPAWYRKHFVLPAETKGQRVVLHFEAAMGKQILYLNGKRIQEHLGGYLPFTLDLTANGVQAGDSCLLAVFTDNSDDKSYPPGKRQYTLDFAYHGGIYRDVWMIAKSPVAITDAIDSQIVGGGGVFVHFDKISEKSAQVYVNTEVQNDDARSESVTVETTLTDADGKVIKRSSGKLSLKPGEKKSIRQQMEVKNPTLWSPDTPYLYRVQSRIKKGNKSIDGGITRVGIRLAEFRGKDGFWLNGKPFGQLVGANRHQDFAYVGNALPNSQQWRDAKRLRDAGCTIIRVAHYPQDPAFMDACDELGLFVIVNTPGWQFWNDAPEFAQRVYSDIRNMVRRDRNHPCVWLWEPILNETWYPADFAKNTLDLVAQEYPYPYCYSGCDSEARGHEVYPVLFTHPANADKDWAIKKLDPKITYFTREWGDNVDDWNSHNSPSRVARNWGEQAMLIQAWHYAAPNYPYTCYDVLYRTPRQHVGGCLWHSFDHQRGYHPDPFYGGLMDVFRQPKYSYYMFQAQRSPKKQDRLFETGPMVYIAHEMTPFSPKDVTVYSNCDEVRLTYNKGGKSLTYTKPVSREGMPSPIITFKDVYNFMIDKNMSMKEGRQKEVFLLAEGLINGKVVATHKVCPARRPSKLLLWIDNENTELKADGSDFVTVIAAIADKNGNIKRLNNYYVKFHIEGEGRILGGANVLANPAPVKWGTAPILVQSTLKPGKIKITASVLFEGSQMPVSAELELESKPSAYPLIYASEEAALIPMKSDSQSFPITAKPQKELEKEKAVKEQNERKLKEVEQQQADFGEKK